VKYETTPAFDRDFKRLPKHHRDKFRELIPKFNAAAERAAAGVNNPWPKGMRVKSIQSASGVWELTWSMSDPDGRATWEWSEVDGQPAIRWRRVGDHEVLDNA
jgi:hypothetical protein